MLVALSLLDTPLALPSSHPSYSHTRSLSLSLLSLWVEQRD